MNQQTVVLKEKVGKFLSGKKKLFINGEFVESQTQKHSTVIIQRQMRFWQVYMKQVQKILI